jgi:hypothetical protein
LVSYTPRNGLELQGFNTNLDTWGVDHLNPMYEQVDDALDGAFIYDVSANVTGEYLLLITDGAESPGKNRQIHLVGTYAGPGTLNIRLPNREHWWIIRNATAANVNFSTAASATVQLTMTPGSSEIIGNIGPDGSNALYRVSPISAIDNLFVVPTGFGQIDLDASILGRYVSVSRINTTGIHVDLVPEAVLKPGATFISVDLSYTLDKDIVLSGLYDVSGNPTPDLILTSPFSWVQLVSISEAEPWKLTLSTGFGFTLAP